MCKFLLRMLGYVLARQPTVILTQKKVNARICAQSTTDRELESVFVRRKVNAWICEPTVILREFQRQCLDMRTIDNRP